MKELNIDGVIVREKRNVVGPHYKRITDLALSHGINIVSVDRDSMIDHLLPYWLENGVMYVITVIFCVRILDRAENKNCHN